jgi:hypothetical protein
MPVASAPMFALLLSYIEPLEEIVHFRASQTADGFGASP